LPLKIDVRNKNFELAQLLLRYLGPDRRFGPFKSGVDGDGIPNIDPRLENRIPPGWRNESAAFAFPDIDIVFVGEAKFVSDGLDRRVFVVIFEVGDSIIAPGDDLESAGPENGNRVHLGDTGELARASAIHPRLGAVLLAVSASRGLIETRISNQKPKNQKKQK